MQFIQPVEALRQIHSLPIMNASTTKVRRKLFADTSPLDHNKVKLDAARIIGAEYERFKAKYNYDFDANKPLQGPWNWQSVDSEKAPPFYSKTYPAKEPASLKTHLMACVKTRHLNARNNFRSLTNIVSLTPNEDTKTSSTRIVHPMLPETPCKGFTLYNRSCGTKRKLTELDDVPDYCAVVGDENHHIIRPTPSPLRSSSETVSQLSIKSQDSVGNSLQNIPSTTTTESSSQTQTSLAQQEKQSRQSNITEYMKSQKSPSEPDAKHPRRA